MAPIFFPSFPRVFFQHARPVCDAIPKAVHHDRPGRPPQPNPWLTDLLEAARKPGRTAESAGLDQQVLDYSN
jgi:hypothetical protein